MGDADRHRRDGSGVDLSCRRRAVCLGCRRLGRRVRPRATQYNSPGTVYTFALGCKAKLPEFVKYQTENLLEGVAYDKADYDMGTALYVTACATCHGVPGVDNGGNVRNLGFVPKEEIIYLKDIVFNGPFKDRGMPDFTGKLKEEDIPKLQAFIQGTADAVRPKK